MGHDVRRGSRAALAVCYATMLAGAAQAQLPAISIYSEFQRIDPFGQVVSADRPRQEGVAPREILSPGLARNAHASYHAAVTVPPGTPYRLYLGQNPEGFLRVTMYREIQALRGAQWVPDQLEPVSFPYEGSVPDAAKPIPGQTTVTFLMDVWVPSDTEVRRTRLELQLFAAGRWVICPLEVRILSAVVPNHEISRTSLAGIAEASDMTARAALRAYVCGQTGAGASEPATVRGMILRNASQDIALARSLEKKPGELILPEIFKIAGKGDAANWCAAPVYPADLGPEWYLRLRDALNRVHSDEIAR
jgi:hypothetical protein